MLPKCFAWQGHHVVVSLSVPRRLHSPAVDSPKRSLFARQDKKTGKKKEAERNSVLNNGIQKKKKRKKKNT